MSQIRLIIAGTRGLDRAVARTELLATLQCEAIHPWEVSAVGSGRSGTVDELGRQWAEHHGIHCESFWAQWEVLGRGAGHARNEAMARWAAEERGHLIAIWGCDAKTGRPSPGTANMISIAHWYGLLVHVRRVD